MGERDEAERAVLETTAHPSLRLMRLPLSVWRKESQARTCFQRREEKAFLLSSHLLHSSSSSLVLNLEVWRMRRGRATEEGSEVGSEDGGITDDGGEGI